MAHPYEIPLNFVGAPADRCRDVVDAAPLGLTVQDVTTIPTYVNTRRLQTSLAEGAALSQPAADTVRVTLLPASLVQTGTITTGPQTIAGRKTLRSLTDDGVVLSLQGNSAAQTAPLLLALTHDGTGRARILDYGAFSDPTGGAECERFGAHALRDAVGVRNTAFGFKAMFSCTDGRDNVAVGWQSLLECTSGDANVAVGASALRSATTGYSNVAVGQEAGKQLAVGHDNVAIGKGALLTCASGDHNVAVGPLALSQNLSYENTAIGSSAGVALASGFGNTLLGAYADVTETAAHYAVAIGHSARAAANELVTSPFAHVHKFVPRTAQTSTIQPVLVLGHNSTGAPAVGFGLRLQFRLASSTTDDQDAGDLSVYWTQSTHATRTSRLELAGRYAAARKLAMDVEADPSGDFARTRIFELSLGDASIKTIASGTIDKDRSVHLVDHGAGSPSDVLQTITGGKAGDVLLLGLVSPDRPVRIAHGTGNIRTMDGADVHLTAEHHRFLAHHDGTRWSEVCAPRSAAAVTVDPTECGVRVTLTENDPVGPDMTGGTIYVAGFFSNFVYLKEEAGGAWSRVNCHGVSVDLAGLGLSPNTSYWLYLHHSAGTPVASVHAWSLTPDADNVRIDGVLMRASDTRKRLLAWFHTTASDLTADVAQNRYLVNSTARCRVRKPLLRTAAGSWTLAAGDWDYAGFDPANQVSVLIGPGHEQLVELEARGMMAVTSDAGGIHALQQMSVGISINVLGNHADITLPAFSFWDATHATSVPGHGFASLRHRPDAGLQVYFWTEKAYVSEGATISSFGTGYHDQVAGLLGSVDC